MKSAVIYSSRYGSTAQAAEALAKQLGADLINLKNAKAELSRYDTIVLGSPVTSWGHDEVHRNQQSNPPGKALSSLYLLCP